MVCKHMTRHHTKLDVIRSDQSLAILDELNVGAIIVDNHRKVTAMNLSAQALMGLKETEATGRDCREIFTGVPCTVPCLLREDGNGCSDQAQAEIVNENETRRLLTRMAIPIYDSKRRMTGCLTILQDHSPIVDLIDRIHHEERSLKLILDNLDEGVFTVNRGGYITFFNKAAEKISGFKRQQVLGKSCAVIFEGEDAADLCLLRESIESGTMRTKRQGEMTTSDGEIIPIRANYMALKNEKNATIGGLATFHDLTLLRQLNQVMRNRYTFHDMIGKSPAMQKIFETVAVVAGTDTTVLIEGPTGTGKDLLAKVIHSASKRSRQPFVKVNCSAIPDNLLESELFGYIKGAFTGADRDKPGRFNEADGGTIFLDEIGDLPLSLQAKLLRVLEEKEFYPLGAQHTQKVDVRIISATNRGLEKLVEGKLFREDLYYRLNVFRLELPPLKDRRIDLTLLIRHILRRLCTIRNSDPVHIAKAAMDILLNFDYPGNVRELENILEHALIISQNNEVLSEHLPDYVQRSLEISKAKQHAAIDPQDENPSSERRKIMTILSQQGGNRAKTARALGIDRSTLWRKMKRYKLSH